MAEKTVYIRVGGLSDQLYHDLLKHMSVWEINHQSEKVSCRISTKPITTVGTDMTEGFKSGFLCIDCGKAGSETLITRDQAIKTGEKYGRGLCDTCASAPASLSSRGK